MIGHPLHMDACTETLMPLQSCFVNSPGVTVRDERVSGLSASVDTKDGGHPLCQLSGFFKPALKSGISTETWLSSPSGNRQHKAKGLGERSKGYL